MTEINVTTKKKEMFFSKLKTGDWFMSEGTDNIHIKINNDSSFDIYNERIQSYGTQVTVERIAEVNIEISE